MSHHVCKVAMSKKPPIRNQALAVNEEGPGFLLSIHARGDTSASTLNVFYFGMYPLTSAGTELLHNQLSIFDYLIIHYLPRHTVTDQEPRGPS